MQLEAIAKTNMHFYLYFNSQANDTTPRKCSGHLFLYEVQGTKPESLQEPNYKANCINHARPSRCVGALLLPWRPVCSPYGSP